MARSISLQQQRNLWGNSQDSGKDSLEPQRVDLFLADLRSATRQINALLSGITLPEPKPQLVRSISFPEQRVRAEPIPTNSIPYNLPSYDDATEGVKIQFILDTYEAQRSVVVDLLDAWLALTRAGRGSRSTNYISTDGYLTLDSNFSAPCQFDINVDLIRGVNSVDLARGLNLSNSGFVDSNLLRIFSNGQPPYVDPINAYLTPPTVVSGVLANQQPQAFVADMVSHTTWVFKRCWCAGYKLSDFTYADSQLMLVDATFYPSAVERSAHDSLSIASSLVDSTTP